MLTLHAKTCTRYQAFQELMRHQHKKEKKQQLAFGFTPNMTFAVRNIVLLSHITHNFAFKIQASKPVPQTLYITTLY